MPRAIREGLTPGEIVLRLSGVQVLATVGYGGSLPSVLLGVFVQPIPVWLRTIDACALVLLIVAFGLGLRAAVWLRPGGITVRRYGRMTTYPTGAVTDLQVAWTGRRAPIRFTYQDGKIVKLPVPLRSRFRLSATGQAQIEAVREWWRTETLRLDAGERAGPASAFGSRPAQLLSNPYAAPTM